MAAKTLDAWKEKLQLAHPDSVSPYRLIKDKVKGLPSLRRIASHIPARTAKGHYVDASHDRHRYRLRSIGCANLQPPRSFADRCAH